MVKQLEEQRNGFTRVSQLPMYIHKNNSGMRPYTFRRDYSIGGKRYSVNFGYYKSLEDALFYYDDNIKASDHFAKLAKELRVLKQQLKLYEERLQSTEKEVIQTTEEITANESTDLTKLNENIEIIQRNQKFIAEKLLGNILGGDLQ